MEQIIFDRLVAAEWIEQVSKKHPKEPNMAGTANIHWMKAGAKDELDGQQKIILFSQLFRELLKGGKLTQDEVNKLVGFGQAVAVMNGIEPPSQQH